MGHRADVQEHHQVADPQVLDGPLELVAHGRRAAADHELVVDEVLERHLLEAGERLRGAGGGARPDAVLEAPEVLVPGRRQVGRRDVQALVVEVLDVLGVVLLGLRVGLAHRDELEEAGPVRVRVEAALVDELPEPVHDLLAELAPEVAQVAVAVVVLGGEVPRREAAEPRHPHRRVGLLDRPGPEVHHAELLVLAVPGEHLRFGPRLDDQVVGLVVALPLLDGRDPVDHVGVHRAAERHAGDQPAAADAVDHGVLLGHPDRRVRRRQRRAHLDDADVEAVGRLRQDRAHQVRSGHEAVGVLVVLVDADAVQAGVGGVDQLVERPVVVLADT